MKLIFFYLWWICFVLSVIINFYFELNLSKFEIWLIWLLYMYVKFLKVLKYIWDCLGVWDKSFLKILFYVLDDLKVFVLV